MKARFASSYGVSNVEGGASDGLAAPPDHQPVVEDLERQGHAVRDRLEPPLGAGPASRDVVEKDPTAPDANRTDVSVTSRMSLVRVGGARHSPAGRRHRFHLTDQESCQVEDVRRLLHDLPARLSLCIHHAAPGVSPSHEPMTSWPGWAASRSRARSTTSR